MKLFYSLLFLLSMALLPCVTAYAQVKDNIATTLYGCCTYSESGSMPTGIYSFPASANTEFTPVWQSGDLLANGGACYANGKYYILSYLDFGGFGVATLLTCDVETKEMQNYDIYDYNISYISTDMTYDPVTGQIYCCSFDTDLSGSFVLSTMDMETGAKTEIAPMIQMCALAVDNGGQLYGIGAGDGVLYRIDKTDASLTAIGSTGITPQSNQSATIDADSGIFYWSANTADGSGLYTVDMATGQATLVSEYPDKAQIVGLYSKKAEDKTPAMPTDVALAFDKDNLSGTMSFTLPETDADGNAPDDTKLTYSVSIDNTPYTSGEGSCGADIQVPVTVAEAGNHYFSVSATNSHGTSSATGITKVIGMDTPKAVTDATVTSADGKTVEISWTLPERGVNEGYIDPAQVTYEIMRMPDEVTLPTVTGSTAYTDTPDDEEMRICYYTITPGIGENTGAPLITGFAITGDHLNVPVDENLTDWTRFPLFTTIDGNDDNATWIYSLESGTVQYDWAWGDTNDDWFITPPIALESGKQYQVTGYFRTTFDSYAGNIEFRLGNDATTEALSEVIMQPSEVNSTAQTALASQAFTVETSGMYNIGTYVSGESAVNYIYFDRLVIKETEQDPSSVDVIEAGTPISVTTTGCTATVSNPGRATVRIYSATTGQLCLSSDEPEISFTSAVRGVYIVSTGTYTTKVIL